MKPQNVLVVYFEPFDVLDILRNIFKEYDIPAEFKPRDKITATDFAERDLVVSVGGDGTFLVTAKFVENAWMLGVNSNPGRKEGFLTRATSQNLEERFRRILADQFVVMYLSRLESSVDGKPLPPALNEVLVANKNPQQTSVYSINVPGGSEVQKSSGIIVSTATGSNGWIKNAGGMVMPIMAREFQFIVREPFEGRLMKPTLTAGVLSPTDTFIAESLMDNGIVVADSSPEAFPFRKGSLFTVKIAPQRLKVLDFPGESEYRKAQKIAAKTKAMREGPNVKIR